MQNVTYFAQINYYKLQKNYVWRSFWRSSNEWFFWKEKTDVQFASQSVHAKSHFAFCLSYWTRLWCTCVLTLNPFFQLLLCCLCNLAQRNTSIRTLMKQNDFFRWHDTIMSEISDWYKGIPRFTKVWLSVTVVISLLAKIGVLRPDYLILYWSFIWEEYQVDYAGISLLSFL